MVNKQEIVQNLKDAGCTSEFTERFFMTAEIKEQMKMLAEHRMIVLQRIHKYERQIYCLDYLVHQIGKEQGGNR